MIVVWIALGMLLGVGTVWLVYFPSHRTMRAQRDALLRRALELEPRALELDWLLWWLRNAVECSEADQTRASLVRYALAAALEPGLDFGAHAERLHRLAADPATAEKDRDAARCLVTEWTHYHETKELPWTRWERDSRKPRWNPHVQRRWYFAALTSWDALLPQELSRTAERRPETAQSNSDGSPPLG
jgi:hypothetical protein